MEIQLPEVPMRHIFSFLDAASLLQVGQVSKVSAPISPPPAPSVALSEMTTLRPPPLAPWALGSWLPQHHTNDLPLFLNLTSSRPGMPVRGLGSQLSLLATWSAN